MAEGRVKWFKQEKGFGFIQQDGAGDVFVHYTQIADGVRVLNAGEKVTFETDQNEKGTFAKNVKRVG